jgi:hypothetical protein
VVCNQPRRRRATLSCHQSKLVKAPRRSQKTGGNMEGHVECDARAEGATRMHVTGRQLWTDFTAVSAIHVAKANGQVHAGWEIIPRELLLNPDFRKIEPFIRKHFTDCPPDGPESMRGQRFRYPARWAKRRLAIKARTPRAESTAQIAQSAPAKSHTRPVEPENHRRPHRSSDQAASRRYWVLDRGVVS